jgi:hypothetical protein
MISGNRVTTGNPALPLARPRSIPILVGDHLTDMGVRALRGARRGAVGVAVGSGEMRAA